MVQEVKRTTLTMKEAADYLGISYWLINQLAKRKQIPYSKILAFTPFADGIEIDKDTGKKPFFKYEDSELMGIYLARLLKDF